MCVRERVVLINLLHEAVNELESLPFFTSLKYLWKKHVVN